MTQQQFLPGQCLPALPSPCNNPCASPILASDCQNQALVPWNPFSSEQGLLNAFSQPGYPGLSGFSGSSPYSPYGYPGYSPSYGYSGLNGLPYSGAYGNPLSGFSSNPLGSCSTGAVDPCAGLNGGHNLDDLSNGINNQLQHADNIHKNAHADLALKQALAEQTAKDLEAEAQRNINGETTSPLVNQALANQLAANQALNGTPGSSNPYSYNPYGNSPYSGI